jgi:hypothetical protein
MGDPRRISTAAGDIGNIHAAQGDHGSALECYHSALKGSRAIGFPTGVTAWLHGSATVLVDLFTSCREMHEYLSSYLPDTNEDAPCADRCRPGRSGYRIRIEDRILCNVASTSVISHTRKASRCAK